MKLITICLTCVLILFSNAIGWKLDEKPNQKYIKIVPENDHEYNTWRLVMIDLTLKKIFVFGVTVDAYEKLIFQENLVNLDDELKEKLRDKSWEIEANIDTIEFKEQESKDQSYIKNGNLNIVYVSDNNGMTILGDAI